MAGKKQAGIKKRVRDVQWYKTEPKRFSSAAQELLQNYSHIPADRIEEHVKQAREKAWDIFPYPCIGEWRFLDLSISTHPSYDRIRSFLKDSNAAHTLLDLGCCFAQDIRKLIYDGVPSENLYACDSEPDFLELGYDLFVDRDTTKAHFFTADIFQLDGTLGDLEGKIDIVHAASFFHIFGWDDQVNICRRIIQILKPQKGSLVFGRQIGKDKASETENTLIKDTDRRTIWRHDRESFKRMWGIAGQDTGTKWDVWVELDQKGDMISSSWDDEGLRRLLFHVQRLE